MLKKKTWGRLPAPEAILACMAEGALVDFDTALRIESRYLIRLLGSAQAKALINLFFNLNTLKTGNTRLTGLPKGLNFQLLVGTGPLVDNDSVRPFSQRVQAAFHEEVAALLQEGYSSTLIRHAAQHIGIRVDTGLPLQDTTPSAGSPCSPMDVSESQQRLLMRMALAALQAWQDGLVSSVAEVNVTSVFAAGFPVWTGGAAQHVTAMGLDSLIQLTQHPRAEDGSHGALSAAFIAFVRQQLGLH
jgi:hypothetical protein